MTARPEVSPHAYPVRLMIAVGVGAGLVALAVLVVVGVPWWRSAWSTLVLGGVSVSSALGGLGGAAWWSTRRVRR